MPVLILLKTLTKIIKIICFLWLGYCLKINGADSIQMYLLTNPKFGFLNWVW
jgi:hypothetical protein